MAGEAGNPSFNKRYALLNDPAIRDAVVAGAAHRFGYPVDRVELRLYVGKFVGVTPDSHEVRVRQWCSEQQVGAGPIKVVGVREIVGKVREVAAVKQYRDNAALVAMKVLDAAGVLAIEMPDASGE